MKPQPIIFTDLDGTLLDHKSYSFAAALPALDLVKQKGIPLVLCSSKTKAEVEIWRERLENHHPFISENGGGIFVPPSSFSKNEIKAVWPEVKMTDGYHTLILGTPYTKLRQVLEDIRKEGFEVRGFGDMDIEEITELTALGPDEARMAKMRDFDEPFIFKGDEAKLDMLSASIERKGLQYTAGGRLNHLMGENDKGKAVDLLMKLYQRKFGKTVTIALGDSLNDLPMLERVDYPILVKNHRGEHDQRIWVVNLIKAEGIGPEGWNKAILNFIHESP